MGSIDKNSKYADFVNLEICTSLKTFYGKGQVLIDNGGVRGNSYVINYHSANLVINLKEF